MNPLKRKLEERIKKEGSLTFSEYMALCLFDPEYGYYTKLKAIGRSGDFVTSPELGPYFAQAIANYLASELKQFQNAVIVELGGGTGQLAYDLLNALKEKACLLSRYLIIEKSPSLKALQQEKLKAFGDLIEWQEEFVESNVEGVLLANEFFDALPVERFVKTEKGLKQLGVTFDQNQFVEIELESYLHMPNDLPIGYRSERCCSLQPVVHSLVKAFKKGLALIVDYGDVQERYYHFARNNGTITAYQDHQIVSVFDDPGAADLTAHVDFTYLAECFVAEGWEIEFLKPQNRFLLEQGILPAHGIDAEHYALKRLLDPRLMGELFKVLVARTISVQ